MTRHGLFFSLLFAIFFALVGVARASEPDWPEKAPAPRVYEPNPSAVSKLADIYKASYAVIIAEVNYNNGLSPLPDVANQLQDLIEVLRNNGFEVSVFTDLRAGDPQGEKEAGIRTVFGRYLVLHPRERQSRVIVFFGGHGFTENGHPKLAPIETPDPMMGKRQGLDLEELKNLTYKNLHTTNLINTYRNLHTLFIFDACFSGSIFPNDKNYIEYGKSPLYKESLVPELDDGRDYSGRNRYAGKRYLDEFRNPAVEVFTAGSAGKEVPAISSFTRALIWALTPTVLSTFPAEYWEKESDDVLAHAVSATRLSLEIKKRIQSEEPDETPAFGEFRGRVKHPNGLTLDDLSDFKSRRSPKKDIDDFSKGLLDWATNVADSPGDMLFAK